MTIHATSHGTASPVTRALHILYADDMRELRRLLEVTLGRDGHLVETASDGREALAAVTAAPAAFDLVITDHHMPNMNGLELVGQLRKLPFAGKIMVFSSELSSDVSDAYRRLGVEHVLHKPIYIATLRTLLATFCPARA